MIEALLSIIEHPTPNEGDRPSHMPLGAMLALGKPDADTMLRLSNAMGVDDFRVATWPRRSSRSSPTTRRSSRCSGAAG